MSAIGTGNLTLLDLSSRMEKGAIAPRIAELLAQRNEILDDMVWVEANDGSGHKTTIRTGIPAGTWRLLNYGVNQEKSTTAQIKDACGMLEAYSTVDAMLVNLAKDKAALRLSEDAPFIEGLNQTFSSALLYGNSQTNPEKIMGLGPRFSSLSANNGVNIIDAGGSASMTSIYLIVWGENTVHGIYPQGSPAGLQQRDLGEQTVYDANNNPYQAFRSHYKWDCGLVVRDWRYIVRIANINISQLTKDYASGADLVDYMTQALELVQDLKMGRPAFYASRTVRSYLRRQMINHKNVLLNYDQVAGKHVMSFDGVPVRRVDQILKSTESQVT
jgi:hypothetical protein